MQKEIPLNDEIERLSGYLENNPRGIFSARFGDGKSYMLNKFREAKADDYEVITLYPVNYQTASNADIFELIKRDILLQLFIKGLVDIEAFDIDIKDLAIYELTNNIDSVLDVAYLSAITINPSLETAGVVASATILKQFWEFRTKLKKKKEELKKLSNDDQLSAFIDGFQRRKGSIYEFDIVSDIISKAVKAAKTENEEGEKKKTLLIIEDMDRLDPAHMFRILNILAAHIDFRLAPDKGGSISTDIPLNKFGFDNTLIVCHYENIQHMFRHFYGEKVDFEGYIHKYSTSDKFDYSFNSFARNYLFNYVAEKFSMNPDDLKPIMQGNTFYDRNKLSIRRIVDGIDKIELYAKNNYVSFGKGLNLPAYKTIVPTLLLYRQLGFTLEKMRKFLDKLLSQAPSLEYINKLLGPFHLNFLPDYVQEDEYLFAIQLEKNYDVTRYKLIVNDEYTRLEHIAVHYPNQKFYELNGYRIAQKVFELDF